MERITKEFLIVIFGTIVLNFIGMNLVMNTGVEEYMLLGIVLPTLFLGKLIYMIVE